MATSVIGALRVTLGLDSAEFERNTRRATGSLSSLQTTMARAGAALAATLTVAAGAMAKLGLDAINTADEVSKAAQSIGIGTEELSRLRYAADLSGVSFEELQANIGRLNRGILDAAQGSGTAQAAFDRLGIVVRNNDGTLKTSTQVLQELADRFQAMPDGVAKSALAMDIFGRRGAAMIPLLNAGSQGIAELTAEAGRFGVVISEQTGRQAEEFNDNLDRMKGAFSSVASQIAYDMLPQMVQLQNWVLANRDGLRMLGQVAVVVANSIGQTLSGLARSFEHIARRIQAFRDALQARGIDTGLRYTLPSAQTYNPLIEAANSTASAMGRATSALADFPTTAERAGGGASSLSRAISGTDSAMSRLHDTATELQQVLDRLFPDKAEAARIAENMATLESALARGMISRSVFNDAHRLLSGQLADLRAGDPSEVTVVTPAEVLRDLDAGLARSGAAMDEWLRDTVHATSQIGNSFQDMATSIFDSLAGMVDAIKYGGFLDIVQGVAGFLGQLSGAFAGSSNSGPLASIGVTLRAIGGSSSFRLPGFANGGGGVLGGFAGVDRNVLSLNGSPIARVSAGEHLRVTPANDRGAGALRVTVTMDASTGALGAFVQDQAGRVVAQATPQIVDAAANAGVARMMRRNDRSL